MWLTRNRQQGIRADMRRTETLSLKQKLLATRWVSVWAIVWPYVKRSSVYPSLWPMNQASRQRLLRRGPLGRRPCAVTTRRDGKIIMETSWRQEIGLLFHWGGWWEFAVSHHNRVKAIDWSLACLKKDKLIRWRRQMRVLSPLGRKLHNQRRLSNFSNTWYLLLDSGSGADGT